MVRNSMKRVLAGLLGALALIGGTPPSAAQKVVFTLGAESLPFMVPYVAQMKGYFKDESIDAEMVVLTGGAQAMTAILSGDAQVYLGIPSTAMKVLLNNQEVVVYGSLANQFPANIVIQGDIAAKRGITPGTPAKQRLAGLKGLTIGVPAAGSSSDQILRYSLRNGGIDPDREVTIAPVGAAAAQLGAFEQKRTDGFVWSSPVTEQAMERLGAVEVINYTRGDDEAVRGFMFLGLISRTAWLKEHPALAVAIVRAIWRAEKLIAEKPDEAREAIRPVFKAMDAKLFDIGFAANAQAIPATPRVEEPGLELNRVLLKIGDGIDYNRSLATVYTNDYVEQAAKTMK
jgi:NitT/TauT family transport system substrate-binding protein